MSTRTVISWPFSAMRSLTSRVIWLLTGEAGWGTHRQDVRQNRRCAVTGPLGKT